MKITIERFTSDDDTTEGLLFIDGIYQCFTLEDQHRDEKVVKETRIPAATYKVSLRNVGNMTKRYAERFPKIHRGMLWLRGVADFEWVYIHPGNNHNHTEGCILVAQGAMSRQGDMSIQNSYAAYTALYEKVVDAAESGELEIKIIDRDREESP